MAKSKKKKKGKDLPQQKRTDGGPDPLSRPIDLFAGGDYPAARAALAEKQADTSLSDADRKRAGDFIAATKPEKGALWTVLACVGFFVIAVVVGIARQP